MPSCVPINFPAKSGLQIGLLMVIGFQLSGCETAQGIGRDFKAAFSQNGKTDGNTESSSVAQPSQSEATPKAEKVATPKPIGPLPGMNARGEVTNPKLVEAGHGKKIKGLGDWAGEITGKPVKRSKFAKLKIGMPLKQVTDIAGEPTDKGAHVTGKAFIPFFFGSDAYRYELVYKGHGRLLFAGGSVGNVGGGNLIWIIHSAKEAGYR